MIEDLTDQWHSVNEAFRQRIEEVKEAKTKLETQHFEVVLVCCEFFSIEFVLDYKAG